MSDQPSYRLIAAAVILTAYFAIAGVLLSMVTGTIGADSWNHIVVIFNAVGALATTAAGVLFGAEIQQANVRSAQRDAQNSAVVAARKDEAARTALEHLETPASVTAGTDTPVSLARLTLQRSLGLSAFNPPV